MSGIQLLVLCGVILYGTAAEPHTRTQARTGLLLLIIALIAWIVQTAT